MAVKAVCTLCLMVVTATVNLSAPAWESTVVSPMVPTSVATVLDSEGTLHVCYVDFSSAHGVMYTKKQGETWTRPEEIDSSVGPTNGGTLVSLAVDSANRPHISYNKGAYFGAALRGTLMYATKTDGTWQIQEVTAPARISRVGWANSIAVDRTNTPHISFVNASDGGDRSELFYATKVATGWDIESIPSEAGATFPINVFAGRSTSLAIDSTNTPHITYSNTGTRSLEYFTKEGGSWRRDTVAGTGAGAWWSSIAVDNIDSLHVVYANPVNTDVEYARKQDGAWTREIVAHVKADRFISIAVDSTHTPHIAYFDPHGKHLNYAKRSGTTWGHEIVDGLRGTGQFNAIAVSKPSVTQATVTFSQLRVVANAPQSLPIAKMMFNFQVAGFAGEQRRFPDAGTIDVPLNPSGTSVTLPADFKLTTYVSELTSAVHIIYYDQRNRKLKYATKGPAPGVLSLVVTGTDESHEVEHRESEDGRPVSIVIQRILDAVARYGPPDFGKGSHTGRSNNSDDVFFEVTYQIDTTRILEPFFPSYDPRLKVSRQLPE